MQNAMTEAHADGKTIDNLVDVVLNALAGQNRTHKIMATICTSIILMKPDIGSEELGKAVREVSRFICLLVDESISDTVAPESQMN